MTADSIYARSPIWLQNCFVSLRGSEYGTDARAIATFIGTSSSCCKVNGGTPEQFRKYQTQLLQETLRGAFQSVPHYRTLRQQLSCEPEDFKNPEDLKYLPILEKTLIRNNEDQVLESTVRVEGVL